jgi:prepilin-type N-terminal cleavage/methylation domain-containing protein
MLRMNRQGFTLIELMVVIVIIGVLASLAIPRFTEASAKAKIAEAPRVLASYESALLARYAETGSGPTVPDDLIISVPTSKWFAYTVSVQKAADVSKNAAAEDNGCQGKATSGMGDFKSGSLLITKYDAETDKFSHHGNPLTVAKKMVPNFCGSDCTNSGEISGVALCGEGKTWDAAAGACK